MYKHITTNAHELALSVVFESGWLHFADRVSAYLELEPLPKDFLRTVPVTWDQTKFLAGRPGQFVVLARRHGDGWYIGGINGRGTGRTEKVALSFLDGDTKYTSLVIADGKEPRSFNATLSKYQPGPYSSFAGMTSRDSIEIDFLPYGGFAAVLSPVK